MQNDADYHHILQSPHLCGISRAHVREVDIPRGESAGKGIEKLAVLPRVVVDLIESSEDPLKRENSKTLKLEHSQGRI